ncbi:MAG: hypothetical protein RL273_1399, partial [Bacteroidota bacterium]
MECINDLSNLRNTLAHQLEGTEQKKIEDILRNAIENYFQNFRQKIKDDIRMKIEGLNENAE